MLNGGFPSVGKACNEVFGRQGRQVLMKLCGVIHHGAF